MVIAVAGLLACTSNVQAKSEEEWRKEQAFIVLEMELFLSKASRHDQKKFPQWIQVLVPEFIKARNWTGRLNAITSRVGEEIELSLDKLDIGGLRGEVNDIRTEIQSMHNAINMLGVTGRGGHKSVSIHEHQQAALRSPRNEGRHVRGPGGGGGVGGGGVGGGGGGGRRRDETPSTETSYFEDTAPTESRTRSSSSASYLPAMATRAGRIWSKNRKKSLSQSLSTKEDDGRERRSSGATNGGGGSGGGGGEDIATTTTTSLQRQHTPSTVRRAEIL